MGRAAPRDVHASRPSKAAEWRLAPVLIAVWLGVIWAGSVLEFDQRTVHRVALFAHLLSLVVGFGAVVVVDVYGLLWLFGRRGLADIAGLVSTGHALICLGLGGLLGSGVLLQPNLDAPLTRIKMLLVLAVLVNGVNAHRLGTRLANLPGHVRGENIPWDYAWRVFLASAISQIGWWGAIVIGFLNTTWRTGG